MTIVVTGATGTIGSRVASQLLDAGATVRVAVRNAGKAGGLAARGAEVAHFDFEDAATWPAAFRGADAAFLVIPFNDGLSEVAAAVAAAAADAGIGHIVILSAFGTPGPAEPEQPSLPAAFQEQQKADAAVAAAVPSWTLIKPTFFQSNPQTFQADALAAEPAVFYGASAGGKTSYVDPDDVAAVASASLLHPEAHAGRQHAVTGPEALTDAQVADALGKSLGKVVTYVDIPEDAFIGGMVDAGTPEWPATQIARFEGLKAAGFVAGVTTTVQDVLSRPARPFSGFLAAQTRRG